MSKKLIVLDAGHGNLDSGAVNGSRYEKNDNLRMTKAVAALLTAQGHTVVLTREGETNPSYADRIGIANKLGADLFMSIHRNSFTTTTSKGIEIWFRYPAHLSAAAIVLEELAKEPHQGNRGAKQGNYLVLLDAKMPAMLIEIGFISNAQDNVLYDTHFDAYATAIARGILTALGEPYTEPGQQEETTAQSLYRVQVGAFGVKSNAEVFLKKVQDMGLAAFLVEPGEVKE